MWDGGFYIGVICIGDVLRIAIVVAIVCDRVLAAPFFSSDDHFYLN